MICAIHQPNFFPYMGIIEKIKASDVFVFLTHCQYEKSNYQNRFLLHDKWYTMPVKNNGQELIKDKKYIEPMKSWNKIKRRLKIDLSIFDDCFIDGLAETNMKIIRKICTLLKIDTSKLVLDYDTSLKGAGRNIDICRHFGCDTYLSGPSGSKYMQIIDKKVDGMNVIVQNVNDKKSFFEYYYGI